MLTLKQTNILGVKILYIFLYFFVVFFFLPFPFLILFIFVCLSPSGNVCILRLFIIWVLWNFAFLPPLLIPNSTHLPPHPTPHLILSQFVIAFETVAIPDFFFPFSLHLYSPFIRDNNTFYLFCFVFFSSFTSHFPIFFPILLFPSTSSLLSCYHLSPFFIYYGNFTFEFSTCGESQIYDLVSKHIHGWTSFSLSTSLIGNLRKATNVTQPHYYFPSSWNCRQEAYKFSLVEILERDWVHQTDFIVTINEDENFQ